MWGATARRGDGGTKNAWQVRKCVASKIANHAPSMLDAWLACSIWCAVLVWVVYCAMYL